MSDSDRRWKKPLALIVVLLLVSFGDLLGQNRKGYFPGDWVSYTRTRFVTSAAVGFSDVYFGTTGGIIRYNSLERRWRDPITISDGMAANEIRRIAVSPGDDEIWVETPIGVYSYIPAFQEWSPRMDFPGELEHPDVQIQHNMQVFFLDLGYSFSFDVNRAYLSDPHFRDYRVTVAAEDDYYHLWVGTYGHGVIDIDLRGNTAALLPHGLYQDNVGVIYIDGETVWFGGESRSGYENAITRWNRTENKWSYFEARYQDWIPSDNVFDITGNDRYVFFGTDYGVLQYDKENDLFRNFTPVLGLKSSEIRSLYLEDSLLFMGGRGTIDVLVVPQDLVFSMKEPIPPFITVYFMSHIGANVWVGTDQGLYRFNERTMKWSMFDTPAGDLWSSVWQSLEGASGDIWFAGINGVVHLDSNLTVIETFPTVHDLKGKPPHRIALADNKLWIGTNSGVFRYDMITRLWVEYDTDDGLIDGYINDMKMEGDYIWFATPEGVTRYFWNNPLRVRDR